LAHPKPPQEVKRSNQRKCLLPDPSHRLVQPGKRATRRRIRASRDIGSVAFGALVTGNEPCPPVVVIERRDELPRAAHACKPDSSIAASSAVVSTRIERVAAPTADAS
jgi:hypothetical protein